MSVSTWFLQKHRGVVNPLLHAIGIAGIIYSIFNSDLLCFTASLLIISLGHTYNHLRGI